MSARGSILVSPMSLRPLMQASFFDPTFLVPDCLESGSVAWLLARHRALLFPEWLFEGWRGESRFGRSAWPAPVLMTLLLLRWTEEGMSRLASTRRAKTDVVWRAALGLCLRTQPPDEKTVREFEKFLRQRHPRCGIPRYLLFHEHVVRLCMNHDVVAEQPVWSMDSTPMWCYGAVLDTIRLLGDGTRSLLRDWSKAFKQPLRDLVEELNVAFASAKSTKGSFGIDWRDKEAVADVVDQLASGALRVVEHIRKHLRAVRSNKHKSLLRSCRHLVKVVADDLETDTQGRLVVARGVAADRLISMTDPNARHGRKSKTRTFNGFKIHALGDVVSGLIIALTVTHGNDHDGSVAHRLITRAKNLVEQIERVLADTAYGGARLRHIVRYTEGVEILAPPPAATSTKPGRLGRRDIDFDFENRTATCKAGVTTSAWSWVHNTKHGAKALRFKWSKNDCLECPLRAACRGKQRGGHFVLLHPYEQELRRARQAWEQPEVRQEYRVRTQVERLMNRVVRHGARQARAWGIGNCHLQAHLIATTCNLKLLAEALAAEEAERNRVAA